MHFFFVFLAHHLLNDFVELLLGGGFIFVCCGHWLRFLRCGVRIEEGIMIHDSTIYYLRAE